MRGQPGLVIPFDSGDHIGDRAATRTPQSVRDLSRRGPGDTGTPVGQDSRPVLSPGATHLGPVDPVNDRGEPTRPTTGVSVHGISPGDRQRYSTQKRPSQCQRRDNSTSAPTGTLQRPTRRRRFRRSCTDEEATKHEVSTSI